MTKKSDGYNWKLYSRAGFIQAIHYGDSLYILKDQFAGVKNADVNLYLLKKIITANDKAGNKKGSYVKSLCKDDHKYYTWSMRYIKPGTDNPNLSSDNATIAVPAGIVVVAVEGEAAVKAIVK